MKKDVQTGLNTCDLPDSEIEDDPAVIDNSSDDDIPPVIEKKSAVPPVIEKKSAVPPVIEKKSAVPPVIQKKSAAPPVIEKKSAVPPVIGKKSAVPPVIEKKSAVPPVIEKKSAVPPVIENTSTVPPVIENTSTVPPVIEITSTVPPVIENTSAVPPVIENTSTVPPVIENIEHNPFAKTKKKRKLLPTVVDIRVTSLPEVIRKIKKDVKRKNIKRCERCSLEGTLNKKLFPCSSCSKTYHECCLPKSYSFLACDEVDDDGISFICPSCVKKDQESNSSDFEILE